MFNLIEDTLVKTWNKMKKSNKLTKLAYSFVNGSNRFETPNKNNCSPFMVIDVRVEIDRIKLLIADRYNNNKKESYHVFYYRKLQEINGLKLFELAKNLPNMGYSMGSAYYVSIKLPTKIGNLTVGRIQGYYSSCKDYARSCTFKPTYGSTRFEIKLTEIEYYSVIGGLVTYIYPNQKSKVKRCFWLESKGGKQHYNLEKVEGFIYEGYHSLSKETALHGGLINLQDKKEVEASQKAFNKASRFQYTFQDSIDAGNCEAGTLNFCRVFSLDKAKKYRGDYLMKITVKTNYVENIRRMISKKVK